jgi:hypothetical protein
MNAFARRRIMGSRREFLKTASLGLVFSSMPCGSSFGEEVNKRPNVILIITDDQGYGDFGATGNPVIRTPNLDALARDSAQMTSFYVSPVCAPTRACLMTGRYNYRTRAIDTYVGRAMMEPREVTVAELLRANGYATGIFGKWHLGDNYPMRPQEQGFEEVLVHRGGGIGQPSDPPDGEGKYTDPVLFHNGKEVRMRGYCTDVYFNQAMAWMDTVHREGRPFFIYLPTNAPHTPLHDVPQDIRLDGRSFWPLLKGQSVEWPDRHIVIQAHRGDEPVLYHNFAIRTQDWKLLHASGFGAESFDGTPRFELYDMKNDPLEVQDVAKRHPEKVEELKKAYEAWFRDVSHTRPDNYAPPRIHVGTPYENPVTLTRQDWRHEKGRPWAEDSNGHWLLYVARSGRYEIVLRFHAGTEGGKAVLRIDDSGWQQSFSAAQHSIRFQEVPLERGNTTLKVILSTGETEKGPWQVDVARID